MPDENMGCGCGCQDCECKEVEICDTPEHIDANLRDKLMIVKDYVCTIALTPCSQLGKVMSKVVYYLWCMLKDLVNLVVDNRKRIKVLTQYIEKKAVYDAEMVEYNRKFSEYQGKTTDAGYPQEVIVKDLLFEGETGRISEYNIEPVSKDEFVNFVHSYDGYPNKDFANSVYDTKDGSTGQLAFLVPKNQTLTASYTLNNTTFKGKKVSKVDISYTPKTDGHNGKTPIILYNNPNGTYNVSAPARTHARLGIGIKFYDETGLPLDVTGAMIAFNSLNAGEDIENFNGRFVNINDSSIKGTGGNTDTERYAAFPLDQDVVGAPLRYRGSIVGIAQNPTIDYTFHLYKDEDLEWSWNTIDTNIPVPTMPTPPKAPEVPKFCS